MTLMNYSHARTNLSLRWERLSRHSPSPSSSHKIGMISSLRKVMKIALKRVCRKKSNSKKAELLENFFFVHHSLTLSQSPLTSRYKLRWKIKKAMRNKRRHRPLWLNPVWAVQAKASKSLSARLDLSLRRLQKAIVKDSFLLPGFNFRRSSSSNTTFNSLYQQFCRMIKSLQ